MYIYIYACIYIYMFIYRYIYIYLYVTNASCRGENKSVVHISASMSVSASNQLCIFLPLYLFLPLYFSLSSSLSVSICISISTSISISVYDCVFPDRHVQVSHTHPPPLYTHLSIIKVPRFHSSLSPPSFYSCCFVLLLLCFRSRESSIFFTQTHATTC